MTIFRNTVFVAVLAGLFAGLAMAAIQHFTTVPLILQAETFEAAEPAAPPAAHAEAPGAAEHEHDPEGWAPADGFERTAYTVAINMVSAVGFALLLVVVSEFAGGIASWRQGVLWGLAGFAVFTLAPGLGLPPELPAMPAADVLPRQIWWIGTAIATGAGLWLIAFHGTILLSLVGLALIVAPHIIGAPQPLDFTTAVPDLLHRSFIAAATLTNLVFWVLLGGAVGLLRSRWLGAAEAQGRLA